MKGRIRTIKPQLGKHYLLWHLGKVTGFPLAYYYALLWTYTDRRERFEWNAHRLKAEIAPFDDIDFTHVLNALANGGFVVKYRVGVRFYGWVPRFLAHQHINGREDDSVLPPPPYAASAAYEAAQLRNDFETLTREQAIADPVCVVEESGVSASNATDLGTREGTRGGTRDMESTDSTSLPSHSLEVGKVFQGTTDNERARENGALTVTSQGVPALPAVRGARNAVAIRERLSVVFDQIGAQQRTKVSAEQLLKLQAEMVFLYWSAKFSHPNAMLDAKRERKIIERLKENDSNVSEILYALDGASHDDWIMGKDPKTNGKKYDDIVTVLRDRGQIERFASTRKGYRDGKPHKLLPELERALRGETTIKDGEP